MTAERERFLITHTYLHMYVCVCQVTDCTEREKGKEKEAADDSASVLNALLGQLKRLWHTYMFIIIIFIIFIIIIDAIYCCSEPTALHALRMAPT